MKERITPKDDIEIYNAFSNENTDKTDLLKWALCGKDYEDLEEQGLIVRLPCKVGDNVYHIYTAGKRKYIIDEETMFGYELETDALLGIVLRIRLNASTPYCQGNCKNCEYKKDCWLTLKGELK